MKFLQNYFGYLFFIILGVLNINGNVLANNLPNLSINNDYSRQINIDYKEFESRKGIIAWQDYLEPWNNTVEDGAILLNFVNADIINVLKYYENIYKVIFITDDVLQPVSNQGKSLFGSKINFTSNKPLSKIDAWNVLITLLEIVGVTLQPGSMNRVYRVVSLAKESTQNYTKGPLPTFIGVDSNLLPESDMRIRYLYEVKNMSLDAIFSIVKTLQSPASPDPIAVKEMNSVLFIDRVYNVKVILSVINELEKMIVPEKMIVIKLKKGNANQIVDLYKSLLKEETNGQPLPRIAGTKRSDLITYFDPQVRLIAEPRMNYIIALGPEQGLKRIEDFVLNFQDVIPSLSYMPIHTYLLKYTQAEAVANVLKQAIAFKSDSEAGKYGGVRNGEKFLSEISILPEPNTNSLFITCSEENYRHIYELLQKIDIEQKQVAIDIVIVSVDLEEIKSLGTQIRNKINSFGNDINFQTGMLDSSVGVVGNYPKGVSSEATGGPQRLLGNLLQLLTGATAGAGTTIISLGQDANGAWGIINMLMTETKAKIINNPFMVVTNKYETQITVGETRRIASTSITNSNNEQMSYTSDAAELSIKMITSINEEKVFINLDLSNSIFTGPEGNAVTSGNKTTRSLNTSVLVNDKEMIAIGGLIIDHSSQNNNQVPWLSQIPIIQWLFKSQKQVNRKSMLIIFISPTIINCENDLEHNTKHMCKKVIDTNKNHKHTTNCPIERSFFKENSFLKLSKYFDNNDLAGSFFNAAENDMKNNNYMKNTNPIIKKRGNFCRHKHKINKNNKDDSVKNNSLQGKQ